MGCNMRCYFCTARASIHTFGNGFNDEICLKQLVQIILKISHLDEIGLMALRQWRGAKFLGSQALAEPAYYVTDRLYQASQTG